MRFVWGRGPIQQRPVRYLCEQLQVFFFFLAGENRTPKDDPRLSRKDGQGPNKIPKREKGWFSPELDPFGRDFLDPKAGERLK